MFKKIFLVLSIIFASAFIFTACGKKVFNKNSDEVFVESTKPDIYDVERNYGNKKIAVVYFSATGNTKKVAEKIANVMGADDIEMIEIIPKEAYTDTDLTSYDASTRPQRETKFDPMSIFEEPEEDEEGSDDENVDKNKITKLPDIEKINVKKYNLIFLGYPIWFGDAPRVIYTFIKEHDLKGKTVIPFCTSGSSGISPSDNNLASFAGMLYEDVVFMSGERFTDATTEADIKYFITNLGPDIDAWR